MNWKEKTCKDCKYVVDRRCRKNPISHNSNGRYPLVAFSDYIETSDTALTALPSTTKWAWACSFYGEEIKE